MNTELHIDINTDKQALKIWAYREAIEKTRKSGSLTKSQKASRIKAFQELLDAEEFNQERTINLLKSK